MNISASVPYLSDIEQQYLHKQAMEILEATKSASPGVIGAVKPDFIDTKYNIDGRGVISRNTNFSVLREVAMKVSVIASCIQLRHYQAKEFEKCVIDTKEPGWQFKINDIKRSPDKKEQIHIEKLSEHLKYTGFKDFRGLPDEPIREDRFGDFLSKEFREYGTIDQVAIMPRFNMKGEVVEFRLLDAATIKRIDPHYGYMGDKKISYVQDIDGIIKAAFTYDELIFSFMNKTTNIYKALYGISPIEMAIELITGFLYGQAYNLEAFNSNALPKGFISYDTGTGAKGSIQPHILKELQREWNYMFSGVKGMFRTPFLQFGAKWNPLNQSNRDMEYNQYMQFLASLLCSIYQVDPSEIGLKFDRSAPVLNENQEARLKFSKDRGLIGGLNQIAGDVNKIYALDPQNEGFHFTFCGIKSEDRLGEANLTQILLQNYKTINEKRADEDLEPIEGGDIILNNIYMQGLQMQQQQAMQQQSGQSQDIDNEQSGQEQGNNEQTDFEDTANEALDDYFKSNKNETIELDFTLN